MKGRNERRDLLMKGGPQTNRFPDHGSRPMFLGMKIEANLDKGTETKGS